MMAMDFHRHQTPSNRTTNGDSHDRDDDQALRQLLLGYLAEAVPMHLPGSEVSRLCDVLHE